MSKREKANTAVALWDFNATEAGQMSCKMGDVLIVNMETPDGWSSVETKDKKSYGYVPTAYLRSKKDARKASRRVKKGKEAAPPVPAWAESASPAKAKAGGSKRRFASRKGTSLADYTAQYKSMGDANSVATPSPPSSAAAAPDSPSASGGTSPPSSSSPHNSPSPARPPRHGVSPSSSAAASPAATRGTPTKVKIKVKRKVGRLDSRLMKWEKKGGGSVPARRMSELPPQTSSPALGASAPNPALGSHLSPRSQSVAMRMREPGKSAADVLRRGSFNQPASPPKAVRKGPSMADLDGNEKRSKITREILETEKTYVAALQSVIRDYVEPMKESKWKDLVPRLFSNLHMLVPINEELLDNLTKLMASWNTKRSLVGPIFQKMTPFMKLYTTYGNTFNEAQQLLEKMLTKEDFKVFMEECRNGQLLDLASLIIQPVQRIPRYRLLLEDLLKNTPTDHADYPALEASLTAVREVANTVNESIRQTEQMRKVVEQTGLQKYIAPHRKLLAEVHIACKLPSSTRPKSKLDLDLYLFNDILVLLFGRVVKHKTSSRADFNEAAWPLDLVWCSEGHKKNRVRITGPYLEVDAFPRDKATDAIDSFRQALLKEIAANYRTTPPNPRASRNMSGTSKGALDGAGKDVVKYGEYDFPEGYTYKGMWKNGQFFGAGDCIYPSGMVVSANWKEGVKHGKGVIKYPTGETYTGEFVNDEPHGEGRIDWPGEASYTGYWLGGRRDGDGTYVCPFWEYEGRWEDGLMDGEGMLTFNAGGYYKGKFAVGKFHGPGVLVKKDGVRYEGEWKNARLEGEAVVTFPEGHTCRKYTGTMLGEKFEGKGIMIYADSAQYQGEWKEGKRHGRGTLTATSAFVLRYEGQWMDDVFHGKGKADFYNGDSFMGSFERGYMHGSGIYTYSNGSKISGEWKIGVRSRKYTLEANNARLEVTGGKKKQEIGETKLNSTTQQFFVTPLQPNLDLSLVAGESVSPNSAAESSPAATKSSKKHKKKRTVRRKPPT